MNVVCEIRGETPTYVDLLEASSAPTPPVPLQSSRPMSGVCHWSSGVEEKRARRQCSEEDYRDNDDDDDDDDDSLLVELGGERSSREKGNRRKKKECGNFSSDDNLLTMNLLNGGVTVKQDCCGNLND